MRICAWVRHRGAAYSGGRLGARAHRRVESHLASCTECARACRAEKRLEDLLAAEIGVLARAQNTGLSWEQIRSSIEHEAAPATREGRLRRLIGDWSTGIREALLPEAAWRFAVLRYWGARAAVPAVGMALAIVASALFTKGGDGVTPLRESPASSPMVIKIAFRPEGVPAPAGYYTSAGETYGTRHSTRGTIAYGWRQ